MGARSVWRCFPWDSDAHPGAQFSPTYITPGQTVGRFDLQDRPPLRYLAESAEHAIGEVLSPFRGTTFTPAYLEQQGHRLALVEVTLASTLVGRIADCTDPATLGVLEIRPDALAHHDRTITQAIARRVHDSVWADGPYAGLRWWSALTGAWHTIVLFTDRVRSDELTFGAPLGLAANDLLVVRTLSMLGIRRR